MHLVLTPIFVFHQDKAIDCKEIVARLSKLKNEMQTDKEIAPVKDCYSDASVWNECIQNLKNLVGKEQVPSWFSIPWLTVECYLYRRIFEAFRLR